MAGSVRPAHETPQTGSGWPRDWLDFDEYQLVHQRYLDVLLRDGFVESVALSFTRLRGADGAVNQVLLEGVIYCACDVAIEVTKFMDADVSDGRLRVISTYYKYHAWRPGRSGESLIRYDQAHDARHPHYHRFDPKGHMVSYADLSLEQMPRLDAVVREAVDLAREWDGDSN